MKKSLNRALSSFYMTDRELTALLRKSQFATFKVSHSNTLPDGKVRIWIAWQKSATKSEERPLSPRRGSRGTGPNLSRGLK